MEAESAIEKSLERDIVLFVSPSEKYNDFLEKIISLYLKKKNKLCLVSLNRGYSELLEELKKKKIDADKVMFIDCISQKEGKPEKKGNVFYVSSPSAYTYINITIKKVLKAGAEDVIFDSLSKLLIYGDHPIVFKYIQDLIMFARDNKKKIFFILLEDDLEKKVVEQIQMLVDKVTFLGKKISPPKVSPAKVSSVQTDAVNLMEKLFGPNASKIVENYAREKKPELFLDEFMALLSKLVGPENAKKQVEELYVRYVKQNAIG